MFFCLKKAFTEIPRREVQKDIQNERRLNILIIFAKDSSLVSAGYGA